MKKRKKSDNYEKRPIDRIINGAFYLLWGFFLLVCALLLFATKGHCATFSENPLPYIVANENISGYDEWWNTAGLYQPWEDMRYFYDRKVNGDDFFGYDYYEGGYHCFAFYFPNENFEYSFSLNNSYEDFDMLTNSCEMTFKNVSFVKGYQSGISFYVSQSVGNYPYETTVRFFNGSNKGDGNTLVPNISTSNYIYDDDIYKVVFGFGNPERPIIPTGHATAPQEFESPLYTQGHAKPANVPQLTINNYTWTTSPIPDLSTLENAVNSIYNYQTWLGENLKNMLTNIVNNIQSVGQFIGETIQYFGGLIVSNIQNMIQTFYNNMVSLFESVAQAIDYISQPLDISELTNAVNSTHIWGDVDNCNSFASDAFGIYGTVAEPNTFKIPLDLRSISLLNITQVYYIDLSWLDSVKSLIRAFMWCIVTFGLLYSIIVDIPNMIKSSK